MLCDDIVQKGIVTGVVDPAVFNPVIERIRKAVKFVLTPEFAASADALATDFTQVAKALEFCRLPYQEIWVECSQQHRPHFVDGEEPKAWQGVPLRVGYLMTAQREDMSAFKVHLFWTCRNPITNDIDCCPSFMGAEFDTTRLKRISPISLEDTGFDSNAWRSATPDERQKLMSVMDPCLPDFPSPVDKDPTGTVWAMTVLDWTGEVAFIEAALALLNCRNVHEMDYVDKTEHGITRVRKGQKPLLSHHVVKIHAHHLVRSGQKNRSDNHLLLRHHFVIGHFKHRKTGLFFWRPHARGDKSQGQIVKDYELGI